MSRRAILVFALLAALFAARAAFGNEARVLDANDRAITVELATDDYVLADVDVGGESFVRVTASGYATTHEPGMPQLPVKSALLGVPFGARLSLEIVTVESEPLGPRRVLPAPIESFVREDGFPVTTEEYRPDEAFYTGRGTYPVSVAELGADGDLRNQRVVALAFHPFQFRAADGALVLNKRIVVRVLLEGGGRTSGMRPVPVAPPDWEMFYSGAVLNYDQAGEWRARPEPGAPRAGVRQTHEEYRLEVRTTGMHRVTFGDLEAAGLSETPSTHEVAIYQRSFDSGLPDPFIRTPVPIVVVDADGDSLFDAGDSMIFFGRSFHDQFVIQGFEDRYGAPNVYWFTWGEGLSETMPSRPGWHDATGLTRPASFRDTLRFEQNVFLNTGPPNGFIDFYTWTSYTEGTDLFRLPFTVHGVDPSGSAFLTARYQGMAAGTHRIEFTLINGSSQEYPVGTFDFTGYSYNMQEDIFISSAIPGSDFTDGANQLQTRGSLGPSGRSGADLDWFSWSYLRYYRADSGRLSLTNGGETGLSEFAVSGLGNSSVRLFDVTRPEAPEELAVDPAHVEPADGGYRLVFQDEPTGFTRYEAVDGTGYLVPTAIERREPAGLATNEADMIVVSYDAFAPGVEPLVERREAQGFVIASALLSDVYDEFGGGYPGPEALRNYFNYAFDNWERQPQFVLLVGDASEDTREVLASSSPNFMPTYLFAAGNFGPIQGSDQWFVRGGATTYLPRMFIGRLPAGGTSELANYVSKIATYESFGSGQTWRRNVHFIADDQWKYLSLTAPYKKYDGDLVFKTVSLELAGLTSSSPARIDTTLFILARYTDPFHGSVTSGDIGYAFETAQFVRNGAAHSDLFDQLDEGAVLVSFEGHGNRTQLTHEQLVLATSQPTANDMPLLQNDNRPFIFLGFSCELARFFDANEGRTVDCVMEQMLQRDGGRGAVATFACTSIAYAPENSDLHRDIFAAFLTDPTPEGPPSAYVWPRWSLGGTLAKGMVQYLTDEHFPQNPQTYALFGDPLMHVEMSPPRFQVTVDGVAHVSGDYLAPSGGVPVTVVADIIDEVEIDPASITVEETDVGPIDPDLYTVRAITDTTAEESRWYRVTYTAPVRAWKYDLKISATDVNGQKTTFVLSVNENLGLVIRDVANYPNPFRSETNIIYLLSHELPSGSVRIQIFTVGGRLIRVIENAPSALNYNQVLWDGRDGDGDTVASGVYLYVIEAKSDKYRATTPVGRMAKVGGLRE
jgi:hypothetical protein